MSIVGVADAGHEVGRAAGADDRPVDEADRLRRAALARSGWALKTTALPAETMLIVLLMIVEVGFVTGVIAATTPNGANSVTIMPGVAGHGLDLEVLGPGRLARRRGGS